MRFHMDHDGLCAVFPEHGPVVTFDNDGDNQYCDYCCFDPRDGGECHSI